MNQWWKDPRLDDEGTYDYLIEELPKDYGEWTRHGKCDCCGKERLLVFRYIHYFYCWDGWDYNSNRECWICYIKSRVHSVRYKIKKKLSQIKQKPYQIKQKLKMYKEMAALCPKSNLITFLKTFYKIIKILNKR